MPDIDSTQKRIAAQTQAFKVAAVQMASGPNVDGNLKEAHRLIEKAAELGARLVVLPEYFPIIGMKETDKIAVREQPGSGPIQDFLSEIARKHRIWVVGGSIPLAASTPEKVLNSCLVLCALADHGLRPDRRGKGKPIQCQVDREQGFRRSRSGLIHRITSPATNKLALKAGLGDMPSTRARAPTASCSKVTR